MTSTPIRWAQALVQRPSLTPDDHGCIDLIASWLAPYGFVCESFDCEEVSNAYFTRKRGQAAHCVFAGHTDVVATGPLEQWRFPPFSGELAEGFLWGRGAADMKSSIAAFCHAATTTLDRTPELPLDLGLLITSDEEGPALHGTRHVIEQLRARDEKMDYCIVGEPSSDHTLGDLIRNGRRGSLNIALDIHGTQGHVAYPQLADNPVHAIAPLLALWAQRVWDAPHPAFPQTSFQISNIHAGTGQDNVIPGSISLRANFRFSPSSSEESLLAQLHQDLAQAGLRYTLKHRLSGAPFVTPAGQLTQISSEAIHAELGITPTLSTGGGTSDGRFIATLCPQVVEIGPRNATIHQLDERVELDDIEALSRLYSRILLGLSQI